MAQKGVQTPSLEGENLEEVSQKMVPSSKEIFEENNSREQIEKIQESKGQEETQGTLC